MFIFAFLFYFLAAYFCSILVEQKLPEIIPGGMKTSTIAGSIGACTVGTMVGNFGPQYFAASLVAAVLGAAVVITVLSLVSLRLKTSA